MGKSTYVEQRTIKKLALYLGYPETHLFTIEEADFLEEEWAYSSIRIDDGSSEEPFLEKRKDWTPETRFDADLGRYLYPDGETALLIGMNPRGFSTWNKKELDAFRKANNKERLESTRQRTLYSLIKQDKFELKELVTLDFFNKRTDTTRELFESTLDIATKENIKLFKFFFTECSRIILGWGKGLLPEQKELYRDLFLGACEKCWWWGPNKDGSPRHAAYAAINKSPLRQVGITELEKALC